jgi:hypothetical protein
MNAALREEMKVEACVGARLETTNNFQNPVTIQ